MKNNNLKVILKHVFLFLALACFSASCSRKYGCYYSATQVPAIQAADQVDPEKPWYDFIMFPDMDNVVPGRNYLPSVIGE